MYQRLNLEDFCIYDANNIKGFRKEFAFLSNFYSRNIEHEGIIYPSAEHAYQAQKVIDSNKIEFTKCSAAESKRLWKKYPLYSQETWDEIKLDIMHKIVFDKFAQNKDLRQKLLDTGNKYLEELNVWRDQFFGVDYKSGGLNNLGKILMKTREFWKPI